MVAAGTCGFQENQSDFHNYAQSLNALLAQGAIFKELRIFLPAVLCQGSESNNLGSEDRQGLWEDFLYLTPQAVPRLRADRPDIPLFTISSELWFLVLARWISPSPKLLLLLLHHPYLEQLSGLIQGPQTDPRGETSPADSIKGQMWLACSNYSAWWKRNVPAPKIPAH